MGLVLHDGELRGDDFSKLSQCCVLQRLDVRGCSFPSPHSFIGVKLWAAWNVQVKMLLIYLVNQSHLFERSLRYVYFLCMCVYLHLLFTFMYISLAQCK